MWDWIVANKEWVFSGAGLLAVSLVLAIWRRLTAARPHVVVAAAIGGPLGYNPQDVLAVTFVNPTSQDIIVTSFRLEFTNGQTLYPRADSLTGDWQQRRNVKAGDSASFHIAADGLREAGRPLSDYRCALIDDAIGRHYRSATRPLRRALQLVLERD